MKVLLTGASALVLTLVASESFAQSASVQTDAAGQVDAVVVTGTRTTGLKAVDSPAPVQVLGNDILKRVGQPDLVQSLAQNIPSIQAQSYGGDEAQFNKSFKLRGLSPNHTLVLINGERRHGTANVNVAGGPYGGGASSDLNYIPVNAIDHVEVLQDGAAAQYGTDAIAGVVNIILKKSSHGGSMSVEGGHYFDQGGLTGDFLANIGLAPSDKSYLNLSLQTKFQGNSFRGDKDPRVLATTGSGASLLKTYPLTTTFPGYPYVNYIEGDGQTRLYNFVYNAGYEVSPDIELYSFGTLGYKDGRAYENYRLPSVVVDAKKNPLFPAGFSPMENIRENDYALTMGAKGSINDTTWNFASTYGRNYDRIYTIGSANSSLYLDTGSTPYNFHNGDFTGTQWTNNLDLTHAFDLGMPEPLTLAGGAEYRIDSYQLKAGDPASYYKTGAQSFFGYAPSNADYHQRSNYAFYADAALSPVKGLKLDGAVRYESYTDFGNTTIFKGTGRYDFNDLIAVRGTASTGFRAPTLAEEFYSGINVGPTSISGVFAPNSAGAKFLGLSGLKPEKSTNFSVGFVTHFLPRLTMTLDGYSIKITDRIVQSGIFYGYNSNPNVVTSPSVLAALTGSGVTIDPAIQAAPSGSIGIQSFVNGADSQTYGADFVATYPMDYGAFGHVDYSFTGNYNSVTLTKIHAPPSNVSAKVVLLDQAAISSLEDATPKWRGTFSAYWMLGPWSVNLRESIYGSAFTYIQDPRSSNFDQIKINTSAITDLEVSYEVIKGVKVTAGANNLLNQYPTNPPAIYRNGQFATTASGFASSKYPNFSAYGFNGGFYYGKLTWTF